jgi:hypothetical protein
MVLVVVTVGWGSGTTLVCTFVIVWEVSEEGARRPGDGSERVKLHEAFAFGHTPGGSWWCGGKYLHLIHTIPRTCMSVSVTARLVDFMSKENPSNLGNMRPGKCPPAPVAGRPMALSRDNIT